MFPWFVLRCYYLDCGYCVICVIRIPFLLPLTQKSTTLPYLTSSIKCDHNQPSPLHLHCPHSPANVDHLPISFPSPSISNVWNRHKPPSPEGELVRHDGTNQRARRIGSPMKRAPQNDWRIGTGVIGGLKFRRAPLFWCGHSLFFSYHSHG